MKCTFFPPSLFCEMDECVVLYLLCQKKVKKRGSLKSLLTYKDNIRRIQFFYLFRSPLQNFTSVYLGRPHPVVSQRTVLAEKVQLPSGDFLVHTLVDIKHRFLSRLEDHFPFHLSSLSVGTNYLILSMLAKFFPCLPSAFTQC